jgi:AraC family transcriptional regulator
VLNGDDEGSTDYLTAVEVAEFGDLPAELSRLRLAPRRYAVFSRGGHISEIRSVWRTIWGEWVPSSGEKLADAPVFERYPESFDPQTGNGGFEIWMRWASAPLPRRQPRGKRRPGPARR